MCKNFLEDLLLRMPWDCKASVAATNDNGTALVINRMMNECMQLQGDRLSM
jgi:hypothetical protein